MEKDELHSCLYFDLVLFILDAYDTCWRSGFMSCPCLMRFVDVESIDFARVDTRIFKAVGQ